MALFWTYSKGLKLVHLGKNQRIQDLQKGHFNFYIASDCIKNATLNHHPKSSHIFFFLMEKN